VTNHARRPTRRVQELALALAALDDAERRRLLGALDTAARRAHDTGARRLGAAWDAVADLAEDLLAEVRR